MMRILLSSLLSTVCVLGEINYDDCGGHLCQNGGVCVDGDNSYTCSCPHSWTGRYCLEDVDECALNNPCQNQATCGNTEGSYYCICTSGFGGANCEANLRPEIRKFPRFSKFAQNLMHQIDLKCVVYGHLNVSIFWRKLSNRPDSDRYIWNRKGLTNKV